MSGSDRKHQRYAHEALITLHARGQVHEGRTNNVSRGGLCAIMKTSVPLGTEVDVDIQLVFEDDVRTEALRVPARVVWCTTVDEAHQIGVSFKHLDAEKTQVMAMFLRYLDAGPVTKQVKADRVDDRFR